MTPRHGTPPRYRYPAGGPVGGSAECSPNHDGVQAINTASVPATPRKSLTKPVQLSRQSDRQRRTGECKSAVSKSVGEPAFEIWSPCVSTPGVPGPLPVLDFLGMPSLFPRPGLLQQNLQTAHTCRSYSVDRTSCVQQLEMPLACSVMRVTTPRGPRRPSAPQCSVMGVTTPRGPQPTSASSAPRKPLEHIEPMPEPVMPLRVLQSGTSCTKIPFVRPQQVASSYAATATKTNVARVSDPCSPMPRPPSVGMIYSQCPTPPHAAPLPWNMQLPFPRIR